MAFWRDRLLRGRYSVWIPWHGQGFGHEEPEPAQSVVGRQEPDHRPAIDGIIHPARCEAYRGLAGSGTDVARILQPIRGAGAWHRIPCPLLVAWPESTQGMRQIDPDAPDGPSTWPHLAAFHRRIAAILAQPVPIDEDGALTPPILPLTPDAKAAWVEYHNAIECELSRGGEFYDVRDVASKSADNAARVAALFQMFEGGAGAIGHAAFESASLISAWHLQEARRFFGELALPVELLDAARLDGWLIEHCRRDRTNVVSKRDAQRGLIRDKSRLDAALRELEELDRVKVVREGQRKTIKMNPALVRVAP